jgi:hypothetical protein
LITGAVADACAYGASRRRDHGSGRDRDRDRGPDTTVIYSRGGRADAPS